MSRERHDRADLKRIAERAMVDRGLWPEFSRDVLSELDPDSRRVLAERLRVGGKALVTSASQSALPGEPAQLLEVAQREDGTSEVPAA